MIYDKYHFKDVKPYNRSLILTYVANILYSISFFTLKSPFLGFVATLVVLITSINFYNETNNLDKKASKYLLPYLIWIVFALILGLAIYLMNF